MKLTINKSQKMIKAMYSRILYVAILFPALFFGQTTTQNYVKTTIYKKASSEGSVNLADPAQAAITITYLDGLGRPVQQIAHKQSGNGKDIITPIVYDSIGRQQKEYLPFASAQSSMAYVDGTSLIADLVSQYTGLYGDSNPYSQKQFEASPLNRVLKQAAPGNAWAMGNGHEIQFDYLLNDSNEVNWFRAETLWNSTDRVYTASLIEEGYYPNNKLYKTITKDENWVSGKNNTMEEFKDQEGHVVLKRTYNENVAHDTYYVYDEYGNLTYVLPPLATTHLPGELLPPNGGSTITQQILDDLCYQYRYDHLNRLVHKKLPGKQWEFIAYNNQDMPIATGPVFSPFGSSQEGFLYTAYDIFGRIAYTGWFSRNNGGSRKKKDRR
ncbi:MAG: DUF6443 domain-containing protein [Flavobacterium sp.]